MYYVIYNYATEQFVCKRKNVSYPLFCDYLHQARVYKSFKGADTFRKQIQRIRDIYTLCIIKFPFYDNQL